MSLQELLDHPAIWRGGHLDQRAQETISTGHADLDAELPGGGWPLGDLVELMIDRRGLGELRLWLPALAQLSKKQHWLAWVSPPYLPYAPALAAGGIDLSRLLLVRTAAASDNLWATEQALRSGTCGAVLAWPQQPRDRDLRRLQLAAQTGNTLGILFRPTTAAQHASPAPLRLKVEPSPQGTLVYILKRRGRLLQRPIRLS